MSLRACTEPGCEALLRTSGRCPRHTKTKGQRGYTWAHEQERAAWVPLVATGRVPCRRCQALILTGTPWDLGHPDADCDRPKAPEHRACNRATSRPR